MGFHGNGNINTILVIFWLRETTRILFKFQPNPSVNRIHNPSIYPRNVQKIFGTLKLLEWVLGWNKYCIGIDANRNKFHDGACLGRNGFAVQNKFAIKTGSSQFHVRTGFRLERVSSRNKFQVRFLVGTSLRSEHVSRWVGANFRLGRVLGQNVSRVGMCFDSGWVSRHNGYGAKTGSGLNKFQVLTRTSFDRNTS